MEDTAQLKVDIDQDKASALGVSLADINTAALDVFRLRLRQQFCGRQPRPAGHRPIGRAVPHVARRMSARFSCATTSGTMVSLASFATLHWIYGSPSLQHYNGFPSLEIQGLAPPGKSSGQAMHAMENMAEKLPTGIGYEWTGQSYEERLSAKQAPAALPLSLVVVFLALAALYENWSIPVAVILVVPLGILGALLGATLRGLPNDVFFKVGLLTIVGLSAKNAILIIEFAKDLQAQGKGLIEATLEAAHLRLRPILMTSLAFILGVSPLALSNGAGSASRHAIGTGVAGGMITATVLAIIFVPVFFVVVRRIFKSKKPGHTMMAPKPAGLEDDDGTNNQAKP